MCRDVAKNKSEKDKKLWEQLLYELCYKSFKKKKIKWMHTERFIVKGVYFYRSDRTVNKRLSFICDS